MSTTNTPKFIENTAFPAADVSKAIDQVSAVAEKAFGQSNVALTSFKAGSETTKKAFESSFETAKAVGNELSLKTIAAMRANAEAGFSHFEALISVKTPTEFVELQTAFFRKQVEKTVEQAKEFQALTAKATEDVSKPIKAVFEKALKELKVA